MNALRRWLLTGLLVTVPAVVTLWVLDWIVGTLDKTLLILPPTWRPDQLIGVHIPGFGALLAVGFLLIIGATASNFVGKKLVNVWNALLHRIPIVRSIYSGVQQVSDTLFAENGNAFRRTVLVQWPREGIWTIAFVTGTPGGDAANHLPPDCLSVYVPTTPNPTGGYFVMLRRADCIELEMGVDEALKYVVSMGVVVPHAHAPQNGKHAPRPVAPHANLTTVAAEPD
ncbi:MAG: DUF502 domain-containing protein [Burkholderiales bacterium]